LRAHCNAGGNGRGARRPANGHQRQRLLHHALEQHRRQAREALLNRLLRHLPFVDPQQAFPIQGPHRFRDRTQLAPDQTQHKGHHHGQVQHSGPQAQIVEVSDLVQGQRMHDLHQAFGSHLVRRRRVLALGAVALDGASMPHTALLGFGFLAHASSLPEAAQNATWRLTKRRIP
jgi:hypothetical protein